MGKIRILSFWKNEIKLIILLVSKNSPFKRIYLKKCATRTIHCIRKNMDPMITTVHHGFGRFDIPFTWVKQVQAAVEYYNAGVTFEILPQEKTQ